MENLENYTDEELVAMVAVAEQEVLTLQNNLENAVVDNQPKDKVKELRDTLRLQRGLRSNLLAEIQARQRAATGNKWRDVVAKDVQWKRDMETRLSALEGRLETLIKLLEIEPSKLAKQTSGEASQHLQHGIEAAFAE